MAANPDDTFSGEDEVAQIQAIPWCARHLAAPGLTVEPAGSRLARAGGGAGAGGTGDSLIGQTLRTRATIAAFVLFYRRPTAAAFLPALGAFVALGGLVAGHPGMLHGGIAATVLDETLGYLAPAPLPPGVRPVVTAYLNTRFLRPVAVPGVYLVVARTVRTEGRKTFVEGFIESEAGERLAEADALFVEMRHML